MGNYVVYMHTSPTNKRYIGITSMNPSKRWRIGNGYKGSPVFYGAIKKFGWDNFKHVILFRNLDYENAARLEQLLIQTFRSFDRRFGYNMESGGGSGKHLSEETKEKLRKINLGKRHTAESKIKIGKAEMGSNNNRARAVEQYTLDGKYLRSFESIVDANKFLGLKKKTHIGECASGKQKSANGYVWKYVNG